MRGRVRSRDDLAAALWIASPAMYSRQRLDGVIDSGDILDAGRESAPDVVPAAVDGADAAAPDVRPADGCFDAAIAANFPPAAVSWAKAVAMRESGCTADPPHNNSARGVFQLEPVHHARFEAHGWSFYPDAMDAAKNIVIAGELYADQGCVPWRYC